MTLTDFQGHFSWYEQEVSQHLFAVATSLFNEKLTQYLPTFWSKYCYLSLVNVRHTTSLLTPAECTMHFGMPVVPEEYMMNRG